jgi:outer membrane lipoprotein carrier protein
MTPRSWLPIALSLLASSAFAAEPAAPGRAKDCAEAVALRVQHHYDAVRDLRARFVQTTQQVALGSSGGGVLESRGEVVFAKPGRMRWSYESPAPSLVVSDGQTLWIYDPEAREVQQLPLGPGFLSGAALQFLLGEGKLLEDFSVAAQGCGGPEVRLVLTPRRDSQYENLELRADPKSGAVRETVVVDLLGNRTTIALSELRSNASPDSALFRFVPPEGTRVLSVPPAP